VVCQQISSTTATLVSRRTMVAMAEVANLLRRCKSSLCSGLNRQALL
jgi:hypothetical protein